MTRNVYTIVRTYLHIGAIIHLLIAVTFARIISRKEKKMTELKPCPRCNGLCHVQIIRTMQKPPKNIRVLCDIHHYVLRGSYKTVDDAIEAWNRRADDE